MGNFSYQGDDIVSCIVECLNEFDDAFSEAVIRELLLKGQFDMLYQKSAVKVKVGIYLPYLNEIFKEKTDDVAFPRYLCRGYAQQFTYTVLDSNTLDQIKQKYGVDAFLSSSNENEPSNMLHYLILRTIGVPISIHLNTMNQLIRYAGQERSFLVGFINNDDIGTPKNINLERFSQVLYNSKDAPDRINYPSLPTSR